MFSISLRVYISPFAEKGVVEPLKWSCDTAKEALNVVNLIWSKADIAFVLNDCVMDKPLDMAKSARSNDRGVLDVLSLRHKQDNLIHIYLVSPIENLSAGGSSYPDSDPEPASFVQWYGNVDSNGRAWAHELGHLMSSGSRRHRLRRREAGGVAQQPHDEGIEHGQGPDRQADRQGQGLKAGQAVWQQLTSGVGQMRALVPP